MNHSGDNNQVLITVIAPKHQWLFVVTVHLLCFQFHTGDGTFSFLCNIERNAVKAVQDNKPFIMNVYHSVSREQVENYLYKVTYDLLEGVVEEQAQGMSVRDEDKAFIATVYKYAFVGLMLDWIKNDMKGDPQLLVDQLELVIHGNVSAALERLRIDKA